MDDVSRDIAPPRFGPPFLRLTSWPYRLEMAAATAGVLILLAYARDLDVVATVFWILWPDLLAFLPIGIAIRRSSAWPLWGPLLYNIGHSFLPWSVVFLGWSAFAGGIVWPLLGWAAHITADRAFGYYLRAPSAGSG